MPYCYRRTRLFPILLVAYIVIAAHHANALECGNYSFPKCNAADVQFKGNFRPGTGSGGFGGGYCTAKRTRSFLFTAMVIARSTRDSPAEAPSKKRIRPSRSVYDEFKNRGYNDCELFGITFLSNHEQEHSEGNYHRPEKYTVIIDFINAVKAYTGSERVDLVTHSLGVSMSLAALKVNDAWGSVRRFINIAGGIRGLDACLYTGPANPFVPTCGSENILDPNIFGLYPANNDWTGSGSEFSMRECRSGIPMLSFTRFMLG